LDIKVSGNGSDSDNKVDVDLENKTAVEQTNYADVKNEIDVKANTGDNEAEDNTGGDVDITTGDAGVVVDVKNMVNSNVASIGGSDGEDGGSLDIEISGNGADSDNDVYVDLDNEVGVKQTNNADIENDIDVEAESGDNKAEDNTGGKVSIDTGDADVEVGVENKANFNGLNLDDCCELSGELKISGNGSDSDNKIDLDVESLLAAEQDNDFDCADHDSCADVEVDSNTGDNKAEDSTVGGDDPSIETGDAGTDVEVSTEANSNVLGDMDFDLPELPDMDDLNGWILLLMGHFSS
jgi:hypothetical protein